MEKKQNLLEHDKKVKVQAFDHHSNKRIKSNGRKAIAESTLPQLLHQ